ncbi:MAG TPA: ribosome biogenesis factor YjgA [Burkholderiales bacterium]|nr:ribosome biogenesis factor YjgA [Burkholderiales bacterium]
MEEHDLAERQSKTRRKQEMSARQDLGEALVTLSESRLEELQLPERLHEAILEAKRITKFGALRRQLQFIGKLMRKVDAEAIGAKLETWKGNSRAATVYLHQLERWRSRLLADDEALTALAAAYPACDVQRVRQLVRNARREQAEELPPASFRALFQALKEILPAPDASANTRNDFDEHDEHERPA